MGGGLQDPNAARRIANADAELKRHLLGEFARAAQDVADKTKLKILGAATKKPVTTDAKHPGSLRVEIAATVGVRSRKVQAGVQAQIRSYGPLMPADRQNLNAYANAGSVRWRRWRHPVCGNREVWVQQDWVGAHGWFDQTVRDEAQHFSDAVQAAIDDTQRYLEGR